MDVSGSSSRDGRCRVVQACLLAVVAMLAVVADAVMAPGAAHAHVTVNPDTAEAGGYATLAFRVPNERDDAATTRVEVVFPQDAPLGHASVRPVPGWTSTVTMKKLAEPITSGDGEISEVVSSIVWKGGSIDAGEFQEFEVSAGRLPEADATLAFKALQTYSNGEVVRWIELPGAAGEEPEHPAPMVTVAPADVGADAADPPPDGNENPGTANEAMGDTGAAEPAGRSEAVAAQDLGARWLAGAALAAGLLALGVALWRRPTRAASQPSTTDAAGTAAKEREKARR
jgi:uncharacterized protein YcnI